MKNIKVGKNEIYKTINEALKCINEKAIIYLDNEVYHEKIIINKNDITIIGKENSIIEYNDQYSTLDDKNCELITFRTYTMLIKSDNVTIENITIKNTAGRSYIAHQAVALHLYGNNIIFKNCKIEGSQDTLFSGPLPKDLQERYKSLLPIDERIYNKESKHYFYNCTIIGDVDFIFGGGEDYFEKCTLYCLNNQDKDSYICAPSHENEFGMTFKNCRIIGEAKKHSVYLARPWRENGKVTFINCYMDDIINPLGYDSWNKDLEKIRFNEINSTGPGGNIEKRVSWINKH